MKKLFYVGTLSSLLLAACSEHDVKEENAITVIENPAVTSSEQQGQNNQNAATEQVAPNTPNISTEKINLNTAVSLKDAVAIFQSAYPEVQIHSVELDSDWGILQYEITGFDTSHEYEMRINANSKEVLQDKSELDRETEPSLDFTSIIDPADAIKKASTASQVAGMSPISWKLEAEYGAQNYSIKYRQGYSEFEVHINASNGELLGVEVDD